MILRVFIVEDEEMIRKGLVHTINWAGMGCLVVGSAADGRSGLSSILQKRPDVVITDIRMPEMDGLEMLERALAVYSFRIILLTSYADFDYARRAISLRACDYLLKPLDEDKLASLMSRIHSEEETAKQVRRLMPLLNSTCKSASLVMEEIREQDAYVDVALERIATHSEQRLRIETLAEEMGVSASYLSRRFKGRRAAARGSAHVRSGRKDRVHRLQTLLLRFQTLHRPYAAGIPARQHGTLRRGGRR